MPKNHLYHRIHLTLLASSLPEWEFFSLDPRKEVAYLLIALKEGQDIEGTVTLDAAEKSQWRTAGLASYQVSDLCISHSLNGTI